MPLFDEIMDEVAWRGTKSLPDIEKVKDALIQEAVRLRRLREQRTPQDHTASGTSRDHLQEQLDQAQHRVSILEELLSLLRHRTDETRIEKVQNALNELKVEKRLGSEAEGHLRDLIGGLDRE